MTRKQADAKVRWYHRHGMGAIVWAVRRATDLDRKRHVADPDGFVYACATPETQQKMQVAD